MTPHEAPSASRDAVYVTHNEIHVKRNPRKSFEQDLFKLFKTPGSKILAVVFRASRNPGTPGVRGALSGQAPVMIAHPIRKSRNEL
jgi:hypothetical protein